MANPVVGIIMGSRSDWGVMENTAQTLDELGIPYEAKVVSAHRTPERLYGVGAMFVWAKERHNRK